jgi:hypothetical protein
VQAAQAAFKKSRGLLRRSAGLFLLVCGAYPQAVGINDMKRTELIRLMVVNAICDDYANVDQVILPNVSKDCAKLGLTIERSEIVGALDELGGGGLAKAYLLSSSEPRTTELHGMPPLDEVEEHFTTYFYITTKGMDLHLSDDTWWPFDYQGEPLKSR